MTFSSLISESVPTKKYSSRQGNSIEYLIIHHTAGGTNEFAVRYLSQSLDTRKVSASYVLKTTGSLTGIVPEEFRPWTTGWTADKHGVTVETVNSSGAPLWLVTQAQLRMLATLAADLCKRYNWGRLDRTRIRAHREWVATNCPGPYLYGQFDNIIAAANAILDAEQKPDTPNEKRTDMLILDLHKDTPQWTSMLLAGKELTHLKNGHHVAVMERGGVPRVRLNSKPDVHGQTELEGILLSVTTTNESPFRPGMPSANAKLHSLWVAAAS